MVKKMTKKQTGKHNALVGHGMPPGLAKKIVGAKKRRKK